MPWQFDYFGTQRLVIRNRACLFQVASSGEQDETDTTDN